jgi:phosphoglycolate phosphatase-like HAD superfamily hydrolase
MHDTDSKPMNLCLFDFDGTLFDTLVPTVLSLRVARRAGGQSAEQVHEAHLALVGGALAAWTEKLASVLNMIAENGAVCEIVSGTSAGVIAIYLRRFQLGHRFGAVWGGLPSGGLERERLIVDRCSQAAARGGRCWLVTDNTADLSAEWPNVHLIQPLWFGPALAPPAGARYCFRIEDLPAMIAEPRDVPASE